MAESFLLEHGVEIEVRDDKECFDLLQGYIVANPAIWDEDKGAN